MGLTLNEYKKKYGLLVREHGNWRGTTSDPFGRSEKLGGEPHSRTVRLEDGR